ncbi:MAG: ATP-binding protein [Candidatus Kariarchaeaceae archaeon]|jgi:two-component system chemotaxis sensor kinase CheA
MSFDEILWNPWLDDMDRIIESMGAAVEELKTDPSNQNAIEIIKIELHSAKGLFDFVGLKTSTQTIFELEENVHHSEGQFDDDLITMLSKSVEKIESLANIVRRDKPKPDEVDILDKTIGFEAILVKFGAEYKLEIEVDGDRAFRSARALGVVNQLKRFAVIKSSNPPEEDLYLDAKFDLLLVSIFTREDPEQVQEKVKLLPNVANVTVEKTIKSTGTKEQSDEDLSSNLTLRVPLSQIRSLENGLAALSVHVEALKSEINTSKGMEELSGIEKTFERIQTDLKKMRKVPLDSITNTFPSMVKRLAKQDGKEINFHIQGRFITLDRSLANHLIDPITQIIRNAISHGIETTKERRKNKKDIAGRIVLHATSDRDKIRIQISDDGRGIDSNKLLEKAKNLNVPLQNSEDQEELFSLIFNKGLSLAEGDNQISGRGLGLFSAAEKINQIGGNLSVTSEIDKGTSFTIEFTDLDALSKNLIFEVNNESYAIPTSEVEHVLIVNKNDLARKSKLKASIEYEQKTLPVTILRNMLSINGKKNNSNGNPNEILLICRGKKSLVGLVVDSLLDERLVNIRTLNPLLQNYELFNGTIAGRDRDVILVVNPAAII